MSVDINQLNEIKALLDSGDRGGAYYRYYELTGSLQALIQAQITTYSGAWGGLAMVGNYFAKLANQDVYDLTLDKFSYDIDKRLFDEVALEISHQGLEISHQGLEISHQGRDGVILDTRIQELDHAVWKEKGMGSFFPGNMQFLSSSDGWANHWNEIFSTGTVTALKLGWLTGIAGLDIFNSESYGPAELGSRLDEFSGPTYNIIGVAHPEFDGRTIRVYDNTTGFLVFIEDTQTSGSTPFDSTETVFDELDPSSDAYAARQALRNYLQAFTPYPMAHDVPPIPNQIPPNVFFEQHELDNGIAPESLTLWHQEILNKFVPLDVNGAFDFGVREELISQFSNSENKGIEGFLNAMEGLFFGSGTSPVNSGDSYDSRMQSLASQINLAIDAGATFNLTPANELDILNLVQNDSSSLGDSVRFSVLSGAPFVLEAAGYSGGVFSGSIAEYDVATYSDNFWVDRVDFFNLILQKNYEDVDYLAIISSSEVDGNYQYTDLEILDGGQPLKINVDGDGGSIAAGSLIKFGSDGADIGFTIDGHTINDRLYGLGGDDTIHGGDGRDHIEGNADNDTLHGDAGTDYLYGGKGDDHLYGGTGNDILDGGEGSDTYYYNNGDGNDTIRDIDAGDTLNINGNIITQIKQPSAGVNSYEDDYGNQYALSQSGEMIITVTDGPQTGTITILGFDTSTNNSGISIDTTPVIPQATDITIGDGHNIAVPGSQNVYTNWDPLWGGGSQNQFDGNIYYDATTFDSTIGADKNWEFWGNSGDDELTGGIENDTLQGNTGNDILVGADGNDELNGHGDNDRLSGGEGADVLVGGRGSDYLFGGTENDFLFGNGPYVHTNAETGEVLNEAGSDVGDIDYLEGGEGNDYLSSGKYQDIMNGGAGEDKLFGGAGC
jgi:Ca2+-binding RTX toxin-like protein